MYRGQQFRSRVEARWAAFFDEIGWKWAYEPLDLEGYIPDFVLPFERPLLVEVKADVVADADELWTHDAKIEGSGWEGEALIVGAAPIFTDGGVTMGRLAERPGGEWEWGEAAMFRCNACGEVSIHHGSGSWHCRAGGCYDGRDHIDPPTGIEAAWRKGANSVQWRRPV